MSRFPSQRLPSSSFVYTKQLHTGGATKRGVAGYVRGIGGVLMSCKWLPARPRHCNCKEYMGRNIRTYQDCLWKKSTVVVAIPTRIHKICYRLSPSCLGKPVVSLGRDFLCTGLSLISTACLQPPKNSLSSPPRTNLTVWPWWLWRTTTDYDRNGKETRYIMQTWWDEARSIPTQ
jgi:hypothetical protein